jgi:hypothetical protein
MKTLPLLKAVADAAPLLSYFPVPLSSIAWPASLRK